MIHVAGREQEKKNEIDAVSHWVAASMNCVSIVILGSMLRVQSQLVSEGRGMSSPAGLAGSPAHHSLGLTKCSIARRA